MKEKDSSRFERFFKDNYELFYRYACRLTDDEEVSRDLVADAFEHAWSNFHSEEVGNWQSYVFSYLRNKSVDLLRHKMVEERYAEFVLSLADEESADEEEEEERMEAVRAVVDSLPPRTRFVLQECYLHDKRYKEVAEELDISTNAVKQHIVKALRTIREEIKKKFNLNA